MQVSATIARSGIAAAQVKLQVAAHNIANAGSESFTPQAVQTTTAQGGGMIARLVPQAAPPTAPLVQDLLAARQARSEFQANTQVFKTSVDLIGSLLDQRA